MERNAEDSYASLVDKDAPGIFRSVLVHSRRQENVVCIYLFMNAVFTCFSLKFFSKTCSPVAKNGPIPKQIAPDKQR